MIDKERNEELFKKISSIEYKVLGMKDELKEIKELNSKMTKYLKTFYIFLWISVVTSIIYSLVSLF